MTSVIQKSFSVFENYKFVNDKFIAGLPVMIAYNTPKLRTTS